ncbi:DUF1932 domain-containing protein [Actinoplanes sp. GCM10030250]|uniref:DUF1932 domain-containing protein n=1 Tax=Actinoplanes sp. GCM10030250 TaxID=3273376 RepID=UPI003609975E
MTVIIGIVSPGFMGAGLGSALLTGGARVVTTLEGRSGRTGRLATEAGLEVLPGLIDVVAAADVVLSVTPPGRALAAASSIAAGVLNEVVTDLARDGLDRSAGVARAATKAHRFVDEMREIAATQAAAGLTPALFAAIAEVYAEIAETALAQGDPEAVGDLPAAELVARLTA